MDIKALIKKICNRETISYLFFGVLTTIVSIGSYAFVRYLTGEAMSEAVGIMAANLISWVLAVAFAYITNKLFVFRAMSFNARVLIKEIAAFVGARLFSLGFEMLWLMITSVVLGFDDRICKILGQFAIVIMNYIFSKLFIFKNNNKEN